LKDDHSELLPVEQQVEKLQASYSLSRNDADLRGYSGEMASHTFLKRLQGKSSWKSAKWHNQVILAQQYCSTLRYDNPLHFLVLPLAGVY